jgi:NAD(P)H-dependent glutamate synthase small subunit
MGEPKAFLKHRRQNVGRRKVAERILDYRQLELPLTPDDVRTQAARCADCGIPFCHGAGCPLSNRIPEFNEMVAAGRWRQACENLHSTNNFPEITGCVCPAPCEAACTLDVNDRPVLIRHIEHHIVETGFRQGWIKPLPAQDKTGRRVAVVGSGPAGLAAAQQLARLGHDVTVFERDERPGGMLRYGIPDFKLEKHILDRRLRQLVAESVQFQTGVVVGEDISARYLSKRFDCVCLAMGAGEPRDLPVPGRGYENILFAMPYLAAQNRLNSGEMPVDSKLATARDKNVAVIGGGDTGSDCVGTARRQGARKIYQLEILPEPPAERPPDTPWPMWPRIMRTSSSHEEGCERFWSVTTTRFGGVGTRVSRLDACEVEWIDTPKGWKVKQLPGTGFCLEVDLVLLAMGFLHVRQQGLVKDLGVELDGRGNVKVEDFRTSVPWVFAAGDTVLGASLVVRAIDGGRGAAAAIDRYLRAG